MMRSLYEIKSCFDEAVEFWAIPCKNCFKWIVVKVELNKPRRDYIFYY